MAVTGMAAATAAMAAAAAETTIAHETVLAAMAIAHGIGGPAGEGGRWMAGVGGGEGRTSMEAAASRSPRPTGGSTRGCYASSMAARGLLVGDATAGRGWRADSPVLAGGDGGMEGGASARSAGGGQRSSGWRERAQEGARSRPVACRRSRA